MATEHYVDNKKLFKVMVQYKTALHKYQSAKKHKPDVTPPPIPEYVGECLLMIATRLSNKANFASYTFREDMISDAIENCFHRSTTILTLEYGVVPIEGVVGQTVTVKARDGHWRPAFVKKYEKQPLFRYKFGSFNTSSESLPHEVIATANHRWFVVNRVNTQNSFTNESGVITDLRLGDWLESATTIDERDTEGIIHGIIFGDGSINTKNFSAPVVLVQQGKEYPFIRVCNSDRAKNEIETLLRAAGYRCSYPPSAHGDPVFYLGKKLGLKDVPFTLDPAYIRGFIYGWWLADGTKTTTTRRLQISTINETAVEWIKTHAALGGYVCLSVRKTAGESFPNAKPLFTITLADSPDYDARVRHIEPYGEDDVFCVEEPVTHGFVLGNGLLTGNCILYMHNFDPQKSQNPFAYFTQITHFAFIRRIEREKKYSYTKYKYALHKAHQKEDYVAAEGETYDIKDPSWASYENVHDFIRTYEEKIAKSRAARIVDDEENPEIVSFDILDEDDDENEVEVAVDGEAVDEHEDEDEE